MISDLPFWRIPWLQGYKASFYLKLHFWFDLKSCYRYLAGVLSLPWRDARGYQCSLWNHKGFISWMWCCIGPVPTSEVSARIQRQARDVFYPQKKQIEENFEIFSPENAKCNVIMCWLWDCASVCGPSLWSRIYFMLTGQLYNRKPGIGQIAFFWSWTWTFSQE